MTATPVRFWMVKGALGLGALVGCLLVTFAASGAFSGSSATENNTVTAASVDHLSISPTSSTIAAGTTQSYVVHALGISPGNFDFGNVSASTTFTVTSGASCTGSSCTSTTVGAYTVTAHYWGLTVTATLNVTPSTASQLVFTIQPGNDNLSNAGQLLDIMPVITVEDAYGNTVTTDSSTVTLSITPGTPSSGGPGTLSGCTQAESLGVITFDGCSIDVTGTGYKLHAVDGSITANSAAFDETTDSPSLGISNPTPPSTDVTGSAVAGSSISASLSATSGSNDNQTITFTVFGPQTTAPSTCGTGGATVGTATAAGDGPYTSGSSWTPSVKGTYWWYVSAPANSNNDPASSTCGPSMAETVVGVGSPALTISNPNPPSAGTAGSAIGASSISAILSATSGTNYTQTITFTVFGPQSSAPSTCSSGGTTVGTATAAGNGTYHPSAGFTPTAAGTYWWYASSPSDSNDNSANSGCGASMTQTSVSASSGTKLAFTTTGQTLITGISSGTITVQRQDQYNNPATNGAVTVNLSSTSSGGIFRNSADTSTITSVTISGGSSSASFLYRDSTVGTPTITAADNAAVLTSATQGETVDAPSPRLIFTSGTLSGVATSSPTLGVITLQRQSASYTPVTTGTTTVNLTTNSSGTAEFSLSAGGSSVTSVTISPGASSVSFYYGDTKAATPTITATDSSGTYTTATQQETINVGTASQLVFTNSAVTLVTDQVSGALTVQRQDQFGNPTTSGALSVNLTTSTGTGQFLNSTGTSAITGLTIPNASSSATFTYEDAVGSPNLVASISSGALTSASQTETINKAGTFAVVSSSLLSAETNQLLKYTATVTASSPGTGTPTGYIEFLDGGTAISACGGSSGLAVNSSGIAICQVAPSAGSHIITAQYLGDSNYSSSAASPSTSPVVSAPLFTLNSRATGNWNATGTWTSSPSGTITSALNSCSVTGSSTAFTTEMTVGTLLYNVSTKIGTVASIQSDTALTLSGTTCTHAAVSGISYSARRVPTASDAVTVTGGNRVTVPASVTAVAASLALNPAQTTGGTQLTMAANTSVLNVGGDVSIYPSTIVKMNTIISVAAGTITVGGSYHYIGLSTNTAECLLTSITTGTLTIAGDLTVANTGTATTCTAKTNYLTPSAMNDLDMSGGAGTLNLGGALSITNPANTTARLASNAAGTFNFDGASPQTLSMPSDTSWVFSNVTTNNTSASGVTLGAAMAATNMTGALTVQSGIFNNGGYAVGLATSAGFTVANGAIFTLTGTSSMVTGTTITKTFGASSIVSYAGAAQTVSNESYGNLTLGGSGTKTMPSSAMTIAGNLTTAGTASVTAGQNLTVSGNVTIGSGTTFNGSSFSHSIGGNFVNSGTFTAGTSTVTLTGFNAIIGGSSTTFNNLTLSNNASLSMTAGVNPTISGTLALNANILTTGADTVIAAGTVTRTGASAANGFVNGLLQKPISSGASSPNFEVGTGTTYAPISLAITGANSGGSLTASSMSGLPPTFSSSGLSQSQYVNRYWTLNPGGGLTVTGYNATFTFANPSDLVGSPNTAALNLRKLVSGVWSTPSSASSTSTTVTGTTLGTTFGQYASGN